MAGMEVVAELCPLCLETSRHIQGTKRIIPGAGEGPGAAHAEVADAPGGAWLRIWEGSVPRAGSGTCTCSQCKSGNPKQFQEQSLGHWGMQEAGRGMRLFMHSNEQI